jgi:ATP-dependent Clp protease adaptor protein ClpS
MEEDVIDKVQEETKVEVKEPSMYNVIYVNDDVTTFEFVVTSLMETFEYEYEAAAKCTHDVDANGSAKVAVLPYEIAEQKMIEVTKMARSQGLPLRVQLEEDN